MNKDDYRVWEKYSPMVNIKDDVLQLVTDIQALKPLIDGSGDDKIFEFLINLDVISQSFVKFLKDNEFYLYDLHTICIKSYYFLNDLQTLKPNNDDVASQILLVKSQLDNVFAKILELYTRNKALELDLGYPLTPNNN